MKYLKSTLLKLAPVALLILGGFSLPASVYVYSQSLGQSLIAEDEREIEAVQVMKPARAELHPELMLILNQIADRQQVSRPQPMQTPLQPIPEPMINALVKMSKDIENLAKLVEQDRELFSQLKRAEASVDRSGNTKEALNDIYSDVEVPDLPDPMAKGLAQHPGARVVVHPEVGVPVLAKTEWIRTHGGRVLQLKRHNGRERPITIEYSASAPAPAPQTEPFRLSLGNN